MWKQGHQDAYIEISSDTHYSTNTNNNYDVYNISNKDPQPTKQQKPRLAPAMTLSLHLRRSPYTPLTTITKIEYM
jgi:hypothetical protein